MEDAAGSGPPGGGATQFRACLLLLSLLTTLASAQEEAGRPPTRVVQGGPSRERRPGQFGATLWAGWVGGRELVAIGAPRAGSEAFALLGEVVLLADRKVSWRATGARENEALGTSLAAVDRIGVGVPDALAIGAIQSWGAFEQADGPGRVELRSLASGSKLLEVRGAWLGDGFGSSLCALGDVDGDGWAELAVGAVQDGLDRDLVPRHPGYVSLVSTKDGAALWKASGREEDRRFGATLTRIGDADGDGHDDLLVGMTGPRDAKGAPGMIVALSAATGTPLYAVDVEGPYLGLGSVLASAPDLDGDGCADAIAAIDAFSKGGVALGLGLLRISAATGKARSLATLNTPGWSSTGRRVSLAVGRDAQGEPLIAVGLPFAYTPHFTEWGGAVELRRPSGECVARFEAGPEECADPAHEWCDDPSLGTSVAFLGAPDERRRPAWAVGAPGFFMWGCVAVVDGSEWNKREFLRENDYLPGSARR